MRRADREFMAANRRMWDESVPLHIASRFYDVAGFKKAGRLTLYPIEVHDVGTVRGKSLLHLQCHFGMDTLSWARLGAQVTGVDFSRPAITAARELADELGLPGRFVESNIYDLVRHLRARFDVVYTGKGSLCWLPDLSRWARTIAHFLKPNGVFYLLEEHPIATVYDNEPATRRLKFRYEYFGKQALRDESEDTYAAPDAKLQNALSFEWIHPVSDVLGSLIGTGLEVDSVKEYPYTFWRRFPFMHREDDGWWHLNADDKMIPLMWSVRARKPA
ncbi:MAG: class I SAM-dependent methyltransferase [Nitrososphaerales archaeon]|jgi:SAM-dependent methyltransferase